MEEYIKKSEIIEKLEKEIKILKNYDEENYPISFGMKLGYECLKNYLERGEEND